MQYARLLGAAVRVVDERDWCDVTVADIASRAGVSRRTFYALFENRDDCLLAMLQDAVGRIERELEAAVVLGVSWVECVRMGLWAILSFFDREPALARVCVVQSARGGQRVLEAREDVLARLAGVLGEGDGDARSSQLSRLTAEGLVGAAVAIVHKRLLTGDPSPLSVLQGELMSLIVLPYLGPAAAGKERTCALPSQSTVAGTQRRRREVWREDPLRDIPMRLTYRTARVIAATGDRPGASNRVVGERAGIYDQGQISKLLARLERIGLLQNTGIGHTQGERNAWSLTALGARVAEQLNLTGHLQEQEHAQ